ncbi:hypothetical protein [Halobacillus seohaensis]|uniref:hypothetical protein n=1 Tax=Halobacillus seohaensis TaxID=447421 RepID=UPI0036F40F2E
MEEFICFANEIITQAVTSMSVKVETIRKYPEQLKFGSRIGCWLNYLRKSAEETL